LRPTKRCATSGSKFERLARCLSVAVFRVAGSGAFEQRANPRGDRVEPEDPIAEGAKRCFWSICYRNPYFDRYLAIEENKLDPPGLIEGQKVKAGLVAEAARDREQSTPKDEPDCDRSWQGHVVRDEPEAPTITQPVLEQPQTPEAQVAEWKKKCPPLADDFRPRRSRYRFRGCKRFEARSQRLITACADSKSCLGSNANQSRISLTSTRFCPSGPASGSLSGRSRHEPAGKTGRVGRQKML
jgi:hypothetical protein